MTILRTAAQKAALDIYTRTLARIRADVLMLDGCSRQGSALSLFGHEIGLAGARRVLVLGAGKAAAAMAQAAEALLEGADFSGLVVTKTGHSLPTQQIEVLEAAHPIPDESSVLAGKRILELASTARAGDLVLVLVSGGASALMELPVDGVGLGDIREVTDGLLRAGADIYELNSVRSCLSKIKAGGIARACGEAEVVCLLLSDVIGNPREVIGSGPCWGAPPPGGEALQVLERYAVPVGDHVQRTLANVPDLPFASPLHLVIGDIYTALEAAQKSAEELGLWPKVYGRTFTGEAREVGARMAAEAIQLEREEERYDCVIAAGETTVTVRGHGRGGRSQELACAAALALEGAQGLALLAAGTDGTDGPTDAAGGLVDGETYLRANLRRALDENDCYPELDQAGALVRTGPTQTNLNDLVIVARA